MNGPELLAESAGKLRTHVGGLFLGDRAVFRGYDLHQELRDSDWVELYMFGITGRRFSPRQTKLLHGIWVLTSYPEARIWNNRAAALSGSARSSPALGLVAGLALSEAKIYGGGAGLRAFNFIKRAGEAVGAGQDLREFIEQELANNYIYGYYRPFNNMHANSDERLPWLADLARAQGMGDGLHFNLAFKVEKILLDMGKTSLRMNYAGMTAALGADLGLSPQEFQLFRVPLFFAGMPPCLVEAAEKPEGTLFPTPCDGISYGGIEKRPWRK